VSLDLYWAPHRPAGCEADISHPWLVIICSVDHVPSGCGCCLHLTSAHFVGVVGRLLPVCAPLQVSDPSSTPRYHQSQEHTVFLAISIKSEWFRHSKVSEVQSETHLVVYPKPPPAICPGPAPPSKLHTRGFETPLTTPPARLSVSRTEKPTSKHTHKFKNSHQQRQRRRSLRLICKPHRFHD
jgi:hypothetical protein